MDGGERAVSGGVLYAKISFFAYISSYFFLL